jgi:uncharacterized phage infection (PIP) family protein YhgE
VATLDDAAEALVVRLQGLDSEIENSEHQLQDCRSRIEAVSHEVEQEWTALGEAVASFLTRVHEQQDRLGQETQQALHAAADTQQAAAATATEAQSEIAEARGQLDGLAHHAAGLQPIVESLASGAGEAPAHALAQRAAQIEQELTQALDDARDFLSNEVVHGLEQLAHDIRERCQAVRTTLAEQATHALQAAFDEWESKLGELEAYVKTKGFLASHDHARAYVDYAAAECGLLVGEQLDRLRPMIDGTGSQVQELASQVQTSSGLLAADSGSELVKDVDAGRESAVSAVSALDSVRNSLASLRFVQI